METSVKYASKRKDVKSLLSLDVEGDFVVIRSENAASKENIMTAKEIINGCSDHPGLGPRSIKSHVKEMNGKVLIEGNPSNERNLVLKIMVPTELPTPPELN